MIRANEVQLQVRVIAYNIGNLWRRPVLPKRTNSWSFTSVQQRIAKTRGRLLEHARDYWLLLAENQLSRAPFPLVPRRIWAPRVAAN